MIYHVDSEYTLSNDYSSRFKIQLILFLNRFLNSVESRHWSTKLKLTNLVWILRKVRHLVKSTRHQIIIYTNHDVSIEIIKQINLFIFSTDKLNLRLIRASEYIQRFSLTIRHKSEKFHIVSDALSKLFIFEKSSSNNNESEFDVLFTAFMIEMNIDFKKRMINEYKKNFVYVKIFDMLRSENNSNLFFIIDEDILYRKKISDESILFILRRMCVSQFMIKKILTIVHDEFNEHTDFDHIYDRLINSWYTRSLFKELRNYLKHCSKCQINKIRRHKLYENLQSILFSSISFHTLAIDFVLILSCSHTTMNNRMSITDKFSKRVIIISDRNTWTTSMWVKALFDRVDITDWELLKVIISDRDRKFLFDLWSILFQRLSVRLLYSTIYHSQTNDVSKHTNQTIEIALRYQIQAFKNNKNWSTIIEIMQRTINNSITFTEKSSNEMCYDFTSLISIDLFAKRFSRNSISIKIKIADSIAIKQMTAKKLYDWKHKIMNLKVKNWALLRFHKKYRIFSFIILNLKLSQQYVESFEILKKIDNLIYKLNIPSHWNIWSVISIAQLKFSSASIDDSFNRTFAFSSSISMKEESIHDDVRSYEVKKLLIKRNNLRRDIEYLIKWFDYDFEKDSWRSFKKLQNAMNLIKNFESNHVESFSAITTIKRERSKI